MNIFLNNVVVASWQIYIPILVVVGIVIGYTLSRFVRTYLLFIYSLFLTLFIPLYPKIPLEGIRNTFVYVRLDDVFVAIGVALWLFYLIRRKVTIKSPLTLPIITYWAVGLLSTITALIFIFPMLPNVFPHDAVLYYLRHIEYLIVFFLAMGSMREKKYIPITALTFAVALILVSAYGIGQRFYPQVFLAYSTMNEEFAKGIPLVLSPLGRIQATFAGHYDLAAYLVMLIPLVAAFIFGFKNWLLRIVFLLTSTAGLVVLLMTASRTSFAVYLVSITFLLILLRKKLLIIPVIIASLLLLHSFQGIYSRFTGTLSQVDVVVDANTGKPIGVVSGGKGNKLVVNEKQSTGENLPQGSGYILPVGQTNSQTATQVVYKRTQLKAGSESAQITDLQGDFVVKKALAYDVSFTTRFQGEWPRAMSAFLREPLLGSGYSSISLASDNNYLRMLGETGILGFLSYLFIFLIASIYVYRVLPEVSSPVARTFIAGTFAAVLGLGLNAVLIDVFEASKDAYTLWLLLGFAIGMLMLYQHKKVDFRRDTLYVLKSFPAIAIYLLVGAFTFFGASLGSFFVADDFTWLRWIADCKKVMSSGLSVCEPLSQTFTHYFTQSSDFFYRPAEKVFFYFMYSFSGFNAVPFHVASVLLHWACTVLVFLLSQRLLKNKLSAFIAAFIFLVLSAHEETILWISSTGHLFVALYTLLGVWFIDLYIRRKHIVYFILSVLFSFLAPLFHESGIVASFVVLCYVIVLYGGKIRPNTANFIRGLALLLTTPLYLFLRTNANSIWGTGDYSYNLAKLPLNIAGNLFGFFFTTILGATSIGLYEVARMYGRTHILLSGIILLVAVLAVVGLYVVMSKKMQTEDKKIIWMSTVFLVIPLLPFLGLGNLTTRYDYLASFGVILLVVYLGQKWAFQMKYHKTVVGLLLVVVGIYGWIQYQQLSVINKDWVKAGNTTYNALQDISSEFYLPTTLPANPVFYFSNVPTRYGYAWVFPNGMRDAVWMIFQDKNVTVHQVSDINLSLQENESSTSARFFDFDKEGNVSETKKTQIQVPITK